MTKTASRAPDLLHGPVFSNMTRFFLPIMLGSLLQQLYSMVDAVVLGRLVGKRRRWPPSAARIWSSSIWS